MARSIAPVPGGIKSVQRGTISIAGTFASATATVVSVDTNKAELRMLGFTSSAAGAVNGTSTPRIALTNATTITAERAGAGADVVVVSYELTELY